MTLLQSPSLSKHLVLVNSYFHPAAGGIENYMRNVGRVLVAAGHRVTVVASRHAPDLPLRDQLDGIAVRRYPFTMHDAPRGLVNRPRRVLASRRELRALFREDAVDVVWARDLESLAAVLPMAKRPPVVFIQAVAWGIFQRALRGARVSGSWKHRMYEWLDRTLTVGVGERAERRLLPHCEARVVLSRAKQQEIARAYRMSPEAFTVIPAGVDTARFHPVSSHERAELRRKLGLVPQSFTFLYVGRFSREKNPSGLLEAFQRLVPSGPVSLVMVGPVPAAMRERTAHGDWPGEVVFPGTVLEPSQWYQACDAFVLPSLTEGFGQVLLEAMSSGLPIAAYRPPIGSSVLATEEIVTEGVTGLLADYDDPGDLSRVLALMERNRPMAAAMGAQARAVCLTRYSWQAVAGALLELSAQLVRVQPALEHRRDR